MKFTTFSFSALDSLADSVEMIVKVAKVIWAGCAFLLSVLWAGCKFLFSVLQSGCKTLWSIGEVPYYLGQLTGEWYYQYGGAAEIKAQIAPTVAAAKTAYYLTANLVIVISEIAKLAILTVSGVVATIYAVAALITPLGWGVALTGLKAAADKAYPFGAQWLNKQLPAFVLSAIPVAA